MEKDGLKSAVKMSLPQQKSVLKGQSPHVAYIGWFNKLIYKYYYKLEKGRICTVIIKYHNIFTKSSFVPMYFDILNEGETGCGENFSYWPSLTEINKKYWLKIHAK